MRTDPDLYEDFWDDDFEDMTDKIHQYILGLLEDDVEYAEISGDRRERESGYTYRTDGSEFKFSLAGTVNSDPEILQNGKRKIVLLTEQSDSSFDQVIKDLEQQTVSQRERSYDGIRMYEFEIENPYI